MNNYKSRLKRAVRRVRTRSVLAARALTSAPRLRPSLILIGAMRAGTTTMFRTLASHPGVIRPLSKEPHYFSAHWTRPAGWYWRHFPTTAEAAGRITFEASASYLFHPAAPGRMHSLLPDVQLLALLRDPVERTLSHYFHYRRRGEEPRSLRDALWAPESDASPAVTDDDHRQVVGARAYVARSRYAPQLRRWFEIYGREHVHVLFSEDFFSEPAATLAHVATIAGLPPAALRAPGVENAAARKAVDPVLRAELRECFRESNQELEALLGRPLPWRPPV